MTRSMKAACGPGLLGLLAWLAGCSERPPAGPAARQPALAVVLSDPVRAPHGMAGGFHAVPGARDDVVYVSLLPGMVPGGTRVAIRNLATGVARTHEIVRGGLDPVPVPAAAGDTLELVVTDRAGADVYRVRVPVPPERPPRVVRTVPPKGQTDVPLNGRMEVVFSEPVDPTTLASPGIELARVGRAVAGSVALTADGLRATFTPNEPLAPGARYTLVIASVADLAGDRLEGAVEIDFTTADRPAAAARVSVDPPAGTLAPGERLQLTLRAYDVEGTELAVSHVDWTSANPAVAAVSTTGLVTGVSLGGTTVTATVEGLTASGTIDVEQLVFASVSVGENHACGLTTRGRAYCWGQNGTGRLGTGDTVSTPTPKAVVGGHTFGSLSAGMHHTCGLTTVGAAYCWGRNDFGELGDGSVSSSTTPVAVAGGLRFVEVAAGSGWWGGAHTCALAADGAAYCWGDGRLGQLGNGRGHTDPDAAYLGSTTPVAVVGGLTFRSVRAGAQVACGLTTDGHSYCWGGGDPQWYALAEAGAPEQACMFELVDPYWRDSCSTRPVRVSPAPAFAALSSGTYAACGVTNAGEAYCWGYYPRQRNSLPAPVPGGLSFSSVSVGRWGGFTCGVDTAGAAYCWGAVLAGAGQNAVSREWTAAPRAVPGGLTFAAVSVGASHACGITRGGLLYCWGYGHRGELGSGAWDLYSPVPVRVAGQR